MHPPAAFQSTVGENMATWEKWMGFVDGENLTLRAQELARKRGFDITDKAAFPFYRRDVYFWPEGRPTTSGWWQNLVRPASYTQRCNYYTSTPGGPDVVDQVHDELAETGFSPVVIHKPGNQRKSKGVDITLTKDMLVQAFLGNYDIAVLVSGDGDFHPVVEEVRRLGKWVIVSFFGEDDGLSPRLRRAADQYNEFVLTRPDAQPRRCAPPPPRSQITLDLDPALKERLNRLSGEGVDRLLA
jgi:uncharacterized LabA/DUF88 family protein